MVHQVRLKTLKDRTHLETVSTHHGRTHRSRGHPLPSRLKIVQNCQLSHQVHRSGCSARIHLYMLQLNSLPF